MKKTILTLIVLLTTTAVFCQPVERQRVVFEIGTGTWCPFCPGAAMGASDLIENGHDVAIIKYHSGDIYANPYSSYRIAYYGISSFPTTKIDGIHTHAGGSQNQSLYPQYLYYYNLRKDVPSPFTVAIGLEKTGDIDYDAKVLVTEVCDEYSASNLVLHFAVTETDIPHVWFNQTHVKDALRAMVPDQFGTSLDFSTSDQQLIDLSFILQANWVQDNMSVVAFVQDVPSKEIFQAEIIELQTTEAVVTFDIKDEEGNEITDAVVTFGGEENEPGDYVFEGVLAGEYDYMAKKAGYSTVEGEILVINDVTVEVEMEAVPTYTVTFEISDAETGDEIEDAVVTFDGVENEPGDYVFENIEEGTYEYKVEKEGYSTVEDEITVEDDITEEVEMEAVPTYTVTFEISDAETGDEIENAVVTFDGVENEPGDYLFENIAPGTYDYKVEKEGYFPEEDEVTVEEDITVEVTMEIDGTFVDTPADVSLLVFPNPARDKFTVESSEMIKQIRLISLSGQVIMDIAAGTFRSEINVGSLRAGIYFMEIHTGESVKTKRVQIAR